MFKMKHEKCSIISEIQKIWIIHLNETQYLFCFQVLIPKTVSGLFWAHHSFSLIWCMFGFKPCVRWISLVFSLNSRTATNTRFLTESECVQLSAHFHMHEWFWRYYVFQTLFYSDFKVKRKKNMQTWTDVFCCIYECMQTNRKPQILWKIYFVKCKVN